MADPSQTVAIAKMNEQVVRGRKELQRIVGSSRMLNDKAVPKLQLVSLPRTSKRLERAIDTCGKDACKAGAYNNIRQAN